MTIQAVQNKSDWDSFLRKVNPNTFLHSWQWGQLQQSSGEGVRRLGFYEHDQLIGVALLLTVNAKRGRHLFVPHGPIFDRRAVTPRSFSEVGLPQFVEYCRKIARKDGAVALRIAPLLISDPQNEALFAKLSFRPAPLHVHAERTWNLDLTPNEEELLNNMRKTTRHAIRKAEQAGITTEITTDHSALDRFWPLYQKTKTRHLFTPFSKKFLSQQINLFSQDNNIYSAFARHENRDVAAAILIHTNNTVFYYHGASEKLPSRLPATQLAQWAAIKEAKRRGATSYNFWGIEPSDVTNHPFHGITVFKQGFGGHEKNYMHAQDLPLTAGYWPLWAIESWRKHRRGF